MRGPKLIARSPFFLLIILASLTSCNDHPQTSVSDEAGRLSFNLSASTGSDQSEMFTEVKRASLLPTTVLSHFREGIADRGQPFNKTDVFDPNLPAAQLIEAGVSQHYCVMSYWQGGIYLTFQTSIFELSDGQAREIWQSLGGLTVGQMDQDLDLKLRLRDLKKIVESGWRHNDLLPTCKTPANAPTCYWTHGRLAFYNGTPAFRLWKVGTHRLLGIYNGTSVDGFGLDNERPELPANVEGVWDPINNSRLFGDFEVCPLKPEQHGTMQAACIESAKNLVIQK